MYPRDGKGRGLRHGVALRDGLSIVRTDVCYDVETNFHFGCAGTFLRLHFRLSGLSNIGERPGDLVPISAGRIFLVAQPPDSDKHESVAGDTHERAVTLVCDREFSKSIVASRKELTPCIDNFLAGRVPRLTIESWPLPHTLRGLVEDILNPPLEHELGDLLVEAKTLELLSRTMHQVLNVSHNPPSVRQRDLRRVQELCAIVEANPASISSISTLCRMLAWNESQMMECFKAVTGTTIYGYRHNVLMNRAKRQLEETDESITQIAFGAGYEHPANFATAFKRTFGIPPSTLRRGRH